MQTRAVSYSFAGLIATCPHCFMWAFPGTIEAHVQNYSNDEVKELYGHLKQELNDYIAECREKGVTKISPYGQDLGRLFQRAKDEMIKRKMRSSL